MFLSQKKENNLILEPLCVIFRLAILKYKPPYTKLSNLNLFEYEPIIKSTQLS